MGWGEWVNGWVGRWVISTGSGERRCEQFTVSKRECAEIDAVTIGFAKPTFYLRFKVSVFIGYAKDILKKIGGKRKKRPNFSSKVGTFEMKVGELRTEGRVYRRCFSRLGTAVVGRANAGGTAAAVRKMRCRSGFARPSCSGGARGQGLACVEGHRGRVCFPCGGGSRSGCAALGKVL